MNTDVGKKSAKLEIEEIQVKYLQFEPLISW